MNQPFMGNDISTELIATLPGAVYRLEYKGDEFRFLYISDGIEQLCGVTAQQAMADIESIFSLIHTSDFDRVITESLTTAQHGVVWHGEFRMCLKDGRTIWVAAYDRPQVFDDGSIIWTGYVIDNTEHKDLHKALEESEAKFRAFVETANDIIYSVSADGCFTYVSPNWTDKLGHETSEVLGQHFAHFVHPDDVDRCTQFLVQLYEEGTKKSGLEYRVRHKNNYWCWHTTNASPILDKDGKVTSTVGIARDITERKFIEQQVEHQAHYDTLTDLPNRSLFSDRLEQAIRLAHRQHEQLALLFLDLDKFKPVNDNYGHAIGDILLQQVAQRMKDCLRESDTVGRIGGDEFLVLLPHVESVDSATHIAEKLLQAISSPFRINRIDIEISCSIGIALYPTHGNTVLELIQVADQAMYKAKNQKGNLVFVAD
ncbi:sensor domain-containing diguanylate cyclase [Kangiella koreensis]|uniref:Diguanylate cyclase with PAS/PAC sensor n=1 Tax=Kangiella koreensis (strain DSM 16069 / JCM 12317 / KCTC 12182 / SW-125) TaxID=523791 RepID=C7R8B2_KANKD|nr:sensor domain-containing diguanylate cyclase [Kangiella koreensis]ACV27677.1 diguanylate cyclase with PAS/PAC sensor [Kangiella koreensis DSM 16069]